MKLRANPLVVAAALGLLGPAALADEDVDRTPVGLWRRVQPAPQQFPGQLGDQIEVVAVEQRILLDDGSGTLTEPPGSWVFPSETRFVQSLQLNDAVVERAFFADGDALQVKTRIEADGRTQEFLETFHRLA